MSPAPTPAPAKADIAPYVIVVTCGVFVLAALAVVVLAGRALPGSMWPAEAVGYWALVAAIGALCTAIVTIGLVLVAAVGLRSLYLARSDLVLTQKTLAQAQDDALVRSTREARAAAIVCCREFGEKIIPANTPMRFQLPPFVQDPAEVVFNVPAETARLAAATQWVNGLKPELYSQCITMLNRLEAWAMPLTHAIADEAAAYGPCANVYLSIVLNCYPMLVARRADPGSGNYPNVVLLFEAWFVAKTEAEQVENLKMVQAALEEQKAAEERNAKAVAERSAKAKLDPALGTQPKVEN